jgi:hypothetical protein
MAKDKPNDKQPPVFADAQQFVNTMGTLKAARTKALAELEKRNVALTEARKKQSQRLSQMVIDGKDLPPVTPLPEEQAVEQARSVVLGINKRIEENDLGGLQFREKFNAALAEHNVAVANEWLTQVYQPALAAYTVVILQGHALSEALNMRLDPKQVATRGSLSQILALPSGEGWSVEPSAKQLHDKNIGLRNIATKLAEYGYEAERRVRANEKLYHSRKLYDPSPRARYKVTRPFSDGYREFKVGDVLDQLTLGFELTRLECGSGRLLRLLPEDEVA